jgi:hypothetical protein
VYDRQPFSWHKTKKIPISYLPAKSLRIRCTRGVYLNPKNISVEGIDPDELANDLKEILCENALAIIY